MVEIQIWNGLVRNSYRMCVHQFTLYLNTWLVMYYQISIDDFILILYDSKTLLKLCNIMYTRVLLQMQLHAQEMTIVKEITWFD